LDYIGTILMEKAIKQVVAIALAKAGKSRNTLPRR
jgi:hypothetical protein